MFVFVFAVVVTASLLFEDHYSTWLDNNDGDDDNDEDGNNNGNLFLLVASESKSVVPKRACFCFGQFTTSITNESTTNAISRNNSSCATTITRT